MITTNVVVRWREGLHLRRAARLVQLARRFESSVRLKVGERVADARSIINVLMLSASLGTNLIVEIEGNDEVEAVQAVESLFMKSEVDG